ncbi:domain di-copper centre [Penicillium longicatenatum]|uniref:domain di-copper centre n=1 Tax=Penicillium longicatenatum TaxID=1561947 RepID=UPI00254691A1|nr:domain di-copper centre [Penicillium longicatenatum]KAJ5644069.1 domain di-copper centre [Penicillium longicatenatum]
MIMLRPLGLLLSLGTLVSAAWVTPQPACNPHNMVIRKEWGEMAPAERINYTDAVLCLQRLPPHLPTAKYPGVRSRFDDFVATHINYTLHVHYSGLFLPWHRQFLWLWEKAVREECGYTGHLPYWNWPLWANDLANSPLFDGSETSLSGDGKYNPEEQSISGGAVTIPRGSGGGCARSGPFKDMQTHLGPFSRNLASLTKIPAPGFDYNPRCLNRSLNDWVASHYSNTTIVSRLMAAPDINGFQMVMDHWPARPDGVLGVHGAGHFSLGATLQDLFASPQDPAFMLHHAMIDRVWAKWQDADASRRNALNGTNVITNPPWASLVTLDTIMEWGVLDRPRPIHEVMSPKMNKYCYKYT